MPYEPIPGQPQHATDEETMSVIRAVLTETPEPAPRWRGTRAHTKSQPEEPVQRRRADDLPELMQADAALPAAKGPSRVSKAVVQGGAAVRSTLSGVRDFRPTTRHLAVVSMALLLVVRPHWFVFGAVAVLVLVSAVFLIVGGDRVWARVLRRLDRIERHDPQRAADLRARLDRFACRWDAILDYFPDGMVDSLYMPDLQSLQDGDAAHAQMVSERLTRMARDA